MFRILFVFTLAIFLSACTQNGNLETTSSPFEPYGQTVYPDDGAMMRPVDDPNMMMGQTTETPFGYEPPAQKVALLLPLSGQHSTVGQSMLNAAQLAVFDMNDPSFTLMPFDTQGTTQGAAEAVRQAARKGAKLILGPLLADNVRAAGSTASVYNLELVGFTTDRTKVGRNVLTLGILPYDQGRSMADYAVQHGLKRIVIIDPQNNYAQAVISAFEATARQNGLTIIDRMEYRTPASASHLATTLAAKRSSFDAIFMPVGNPVLPALASALKSQGLDASVKPWMGAGLWDDRTIRANSLMQGAVYAAPTENQRKRFEQEYRAIYGQTPQRLASLAYDATALAVVLLRQNQTVSHAALLNPNGFAGIDGIFRFHSNGIAERGLAVHQITGRGDSMIVTPAPTSFVD